MTSYLNIATYPAGLRNNNPGHLARTSIAWDGKIPFAQSQDKNFEQFYELRYGIRALMRDIISDVGNGKNTIRKFITSYAPAFQNNTAAYILYVGEALGISPDAPIELTEESLLALCKVIITVENGATWAAKIKDSDYNDALAILGKPLKKKVHKPITR